MTISNLPRTILFVCTGNYYRSRIAEILFNHYAKREALPVTSYSRGLRLNPAKNTGVISPHALPFLSDLNISLESVGSASGLTTEDLEQASHVIIMDEIEHRPMMREKFPEWEHRVEYWQLEDDYVVTPEIVLPRLQTKVESLVSVLSVKRAGR